MKQPIRTLGALALGASVVAVAALSVRSGPASGAPTDPTEPATHTITVSASGTVTLVPDVALVSLGVTIDKPTVKAARAAAAQAMTTVIDGLKQLGIAETDIQTTDISLYPRYGEGSNSRIVAYQMREQVRVTVRDLDKAGDVVDTATANGATTVNGISFEVADPAEAMNQARADAVASARASAEALAAAGRVTLGDVVSIVDGTPNVPIPYGYGARAAAVPDVATPVEPGTQDLTAMVTVVFEID